MQVHLNLKTKISIVRYYCNGYTVRYISTVLNVNRSTVNDYIKRFLSGKSFSNKIAQRKKKIIAQDVYYAIELIIEDPSISYKEIIRRLKLNVSVNTLRNALSIKGLRSYIGCEKLFLKLDHQVARLKFAHAHKDWDEEWNRVIFTDEKTIQCYRNGPVKIIRKRGERYQQNNIVTRERQCSVKVNLFGGISYGSVNKIIPVSTKFKGEECLKTIQDNFESFLKKDKLIFLCDNAKLHNKTIEYLKEKKIPVIAFPPKSPDLNPIEHVWAKLQKLVDEQLKFKTISKEVDLIKVIENCWLKISEDFKKNLIVSMRNRVNEVIKNQGRQTRY